MERKANIDPTYFERVLQVTSHLCMKNGFPNGRVRDALPPVAEPDRPLRQRPRGLQQDRRRVRQAVPPQPPPRAAPLPLHRCLRGPERGGDWVRAGFDQIQFNFQQH